MVLIDDFKYEANPPSSVDPPDLARYTYEELQRVRDALDVTTRWDDLRFPASGIRITGAGGAFPPGDDSTTGLLLFDPGRTETVGGVAQLPHSWKEESTVRPHVHWQKTTSAAGNVYWQFDYEVWNNGDTALLTYANTLFSTSPVAGTPDNNTANEILITSFGDIDMTGMTASSLIFWRLSRIGGNAADTYGADARLVEFDIHYEIDSFGSAMEFVKR